MYEFIIHSKTKNNTSIWHLIILELKLLNTECIEQKINKLEGDAVNNGGVIYDLCSGRQSLWQRLHGHLVEALERNLLKRCYIKFTQTGDKMTLYNFIRQLKQDKPKN